VKHLSLIVGAGVTLSLLTAGFIWWSAVTKAPSASSEVVRVVIKKGRTASQIANDLYEKGLIRSPLAFKFYVQLSGKSRSIGAGEFGIPRNIDMYEVLDKLSGSPLEVWVTIPEGLRKEEVVEKFIKGLEIPTDRQEQFRKKFMNTIVEGYAFPDTYLFSRDVDGEFVARKMMEVFDQKVGKVENDKGRHNLSSQEVVILASIIERETRREDERPVVAGILLNRLKIGMALQVDATVQYAVASIRCGARPSLCQEWWPKLTLEDLKVDSPFNTYKFPGLPPAAIANPGLQSIRAVLDPAETDYLYYLHDPDGVIHYARTISEHYNNVARYLKN